MLLDDLHALYEVAVQRIQSASKEELEALRVEVLGKRGTLTSILRGLGKVDPAERKEIGRRANEIKEEIYRSILERKEDLLRASSVIE